MKQQDVKILPYETVGFSPPLKMSITFGSFENLHPTPWIDAIFKWSKLLYSSSDVGLFAKRYTIESL